MVVSGYRRKEGIAEPAFLLFNRAKPAEKTINLMLKETPEKNVIKNWL